MRGVSDGKVCFQPDTPDSIRLRSFSKTFSLPTPHPPPPRTLRCKATFFKRRKRSSVFRSAVSFQSVTTALSSNLHKLYEVGSFKRKKNAFFMAQNKGSRRLEGRAAFTVSALGF